MKKFLILILLVFFILTGGCGERKPSKSPEELSKQAKKIFGTVPEKMPGSENDTPDLVFLGEKLYFDKTLSVNGSQSCNTCHRIDNNGPGVDNLPTSPGAHGKKGKRNSPTVLDAGFQFTQFWDGKASTLEEQAKVPMVNPLEMAMADEKMVVKKISESKEYRELFKKAFPDSKEAINYDNITKAIGSYERTLITVNRFDDFIGGNSGAITREEQIGYELFINTTCIFCHNGPLLGGKMYQKTGVVHPYEDTGDMGRYEVTKKEQDRYLFKVPMMRNVAITYPYFHDGRIETLEEAVKIMAKIQLDKDLTNEEVMYIVTFLGSLTGKGRVPVKEIR